MILKKFKLLPIAGDASHRKFYRKIYKYQNISTIVVFSKKEKPKNLLVYSAINQLLLKNNIKAPKLLKQNYKKNFIEIEDFGNIMFHNVLTQSKSKLYLYKRIIDLLIRLQKIKPKKIKNFLGKFYNLKKYTIKELHKESDLFFKWYLPLIMKKSQAFKLKLILRKKLHIFYKKLKFKNNIFVHRDFHSFNLMKIKQNIGIIDSQDAIIGNPTYDLVSLIDDVRIKTSNKLKKDIFNYYLKKGSKNYRSKKEDFINDFNILSIQRSLKIIGIFSRLFKRDKKKKYLRLIPYAWKLLELRLKGKMFDEINDVLNKFISPKTRGKIYFHEN